MLDPSLLQAARSRRWQAAAVLGLVALVAAALLGGFRRAPAKTVPLHAAGERVATAALAVKPLRAWLDTRNPRGQADTTGQREFLVLEAVAENLTPASNGWYLDSDLRWLASREDHAGAKPDLIYLAEDKTLTHVLQPHLPVQLLLVWKIPPGRATAEPMRWGLYGRRFVEKTFLTTESGWLQDGPAATFKLAVEDRRAQAAAP
jgi:hypothetical protein